MSVYLGNSGGIEIRRQGEPVDVDLLPQDVSVSERRFSVDFDPTYNNPRPSPLITGDQVQFGSADGTSNLTLVAGLTDTDVTRWVHVDEIGGIRLFNSYAEAITGNKENAVELVEPTANQEITIDVVNVTYNCFAQMRSWELTTTRETVNLDVLGEEYRQFYDQGLISGQGAINAIWDYKYTPCVDSFSDDAELANYFSQLVVRFREGSKFKGIFTVHFNKNESVWYECDCICTSVGMNFSPGEVIDSTIQFITTGQVWLKQGEPPAFLLLELGIDNEILLEQPPGAIELEFDE